MFGATNPPKLPKAPIKAVPAAAERPRKYWVGKFQNKGCTMMKPIIAKVIAITNVTTECICVAKPMPTTAQPNIAIAI